MPKGKLLTQEELAEIKEKAKEYKNYCYAEQDIPKLLEHIEHLNYKLDVCYCGHERIYHTFYGEPDREFTGSCVDILCNCCGFHTKPIIEIDHCETCKLGPKGCPFEPRN